MLKKQIIDFLLAVFIYLLLFYSIFDVYYTSPLVQGLESIPLDIEPLATHLIFIVSDGLRANIIFDADMHNTPFLKDLLLHHGVWGLSHTRVPTESRPGHIAMFAGFYEDVSSITKGWKVNPVEFDSIFNRSAESWGWGNPYLLLSFNASSSNYKFHISMIPIALLDSMNTEVTSLDDWVVQHFSEFLNQSTDFMKTNTIQSQSARYGKVAFLHLDSADAVGHGFKPNSKEYVKMLTNLDTSIKRIVTEVDVQSKGTNARIAYIFTADHGMTEWGSHGAGSLHETVTPLLAWGSGIVKPTFIDSSLSDSQVDQYGIHTHNYGRLRREIEQADLCPLMASLLGISIPVNSVGQIPLDFLDLSLEDKVKLSRVNYLQILVQLKKKYREKYDTHFSFFFREFKYLKMADVDYHLFEAEQLVLKGKWTEAIQKFKYLTRLALDALNYYHSYDRLFLGFCIGLTFIMWSLVLLCELVEEPLPFELRRIKSQLGWSIRVTFSLLFICALSLIGILFFLAWLFSWSLMHAVYQITPLVLVAILSWPSSKTNKKLSSFICDYWLDGKKRQSSIGMAVPLTLVTSVCLIEFAIWGFFYRYLLSVACVIVGVWPLVDKTFGQNKVFLRLMWTIGCLGLALFPLFPVIGSEQYPHVVLLSGLLMVIVEFVCFQTVCSNFDAVSLPVSSSFFAWPKSSSILNIFYATILCIASFSVYFMSYVVQQFFIVQIFIHIFSWSILVILPLSVILCIKPLIGPRFVAWFVVYLTPLLLMSSFYEVLFFALFSFVGYLWICLESETASQSTMWNIVTNANSHLDLDNNEKRSSMSQSLLTLKNYRQSVFFIFFLIISFFGTGNIASVNSFDPRSTFCFTTSIVPSVMAICLLIKVISPMLFLGVIYASVQHCSYVSKSDLHSLNLKRSNRFDDAICKSYQNSIIAQTGLSAVISNIIAIHFFMWLRDEGSWLDIGTSIGHYVIVMAISLFAFLFTIFGRKMLSLSIKFYFV